MVKSTGKKTKGKQEVRHSPDLDEGVVEDTNQLGSDRQIPSKTLILATKLHRPPVASDILPRDRLSEELNEGFQRPLTLISAPALGYLLMSPTMICDRS